MFKSCIAIFAAMQDQPVRPPKGSDRVGYDVALYRFGVRFHHLEALRQGFQPGQAGRPLRLPAQGFAYGLLELGRQGGLQHTSGTPGSRCARPTFTPSAVCVSMVVP